MLTPAPDLLTPLNGTISVSGSESKSADSWDATLHKSTVSEVKNAS
ncbi:hypothetical protein [Cedecea neteri]